MKTCLGCLLLIPVIAAVVATAVYHTSVNGELKFELKDTDAPYINTQRSYRKPVPAKPTMPAAPANDAKPAPAPATPGKVPEMQDDMVAEEA